MADAAVIEFARDYLVSAARTAGQSVGQLVAAAPTARRVSHTVNLVLPDGRKMRVFALAELVEDKGAAGDA